MGSLASHRLIAHRSTTRLLAIVLVAAGVIGGCGVPGSDRDRSQVELRTCLALLERSGRPTTGIDASDFVSSLDELVDSDRPYSSLEPFTRACRSSG